MRYLPILLLLLLSLKAAAIVPMDTVAPSLYSLQQSPAPQDPEFRLYGMDERRRLLPTYSPRKEQKAKRLLIFGSVFLSTGAMAIAYGAISASGAHGPNENIRSFAIGMLGGYACAGGLGFAIPGAVMLRKNHARRREQGLD